MEGIVRHVIKIGDQWETRAEKEATIFRTTRSAACNDFPELAAFPGPVQTMMAEQIKLAILDNEDSNTPPAGELDDVLTCPIGSEASQGCLFYRQYQLPCRHLWQYEVLYGVFRHSDWERWNALFDDGGFEIYESTTKTYVIDEIHDIIGGPDRQALEMREVLDSIKDKYYDIVENTAAWTAEQRIPILEGWISWLGRLTGPIRAAGVEEALKELDSEAVGPLAEGRINDEVRRKRQRQRDSDEEELED